jgi:hypothetical protein
LSVRISSRHNRQEGGTLAEIEYSNTYSGWKVRDSWDENISAWNFKPIEGNYIPCQIAYKAVDFTRIIYQEEEAY